MQPWRSQKKNGPQPLCRECGREEVAASGGICVTCANRLRYQKKSAATHLKACHEIAERLYKIDREKYRDIFSFINKSLKRGSSLTQILHTVEALEIKIGGRGTARRVPTLDVGPETPPTGSVFAYLSGTLRRLEEKSEATKFRRGGVTRIGEIPLNLKDLAAMKGNK